MIPASLRIPAFRRLLGAFALSALGSMMTFIVLPLVAWHETGSASTFAFVLAAGAAGMLIAMPFGGVVADRFDRRHVIMVGQACSFLVILTMIAAVRAELWWVLPFVELMQTFLGSLTSSAAPALRRDVLTDEVRTQGTALLSAAGSSVQLLAPLVGGALYVAFGFTTVMVLDLTCVALAFVLVRGIRLAPDLTRPNAPQADDERGMVRRTLTDIRDGFVVARRDAFLARYILGGSLGGVSNGLVLVAIVPWLELELGMAPEFWGAAIAVMGSSGLVTAVVVAHLGERIAAHRLLLVGAASLAVGALALVGEPSVPRLVLAFAVIGCTNQAFAISCGTIVQRRVASSHQGRISSLWVCAAQSTQLVATLFAGVALDMFGADAAMLVAIVVFCLTAVVYGSAARAARVAPVAFTDDELALGA